VELAGNPGKRPLNRYEPQPLRKRPRCPDYLDEIAKREWNRLAPILERMRALTEADGIALANLCQQYSMLQTAQIKLQKTSLLLKTKSGYVQQSPLVGIISAAVEFGLTPAARTRIEVGPQDLEPLNGGRGSTLNGQWHRKAPWPTQPGDAGSGTDRVVPC